MFNKALSEIKKERKNIQKQLDAARKKHLYNGWDIGNCADVYTIEYEGILYYISPSYYCVVDNYDENGSVELSHHESNGYSVVEDYKGEGSELNFGFMRVQDMINVVIKPGIERIKINSQNIRYATFRSHTPVDFIITYNNGMIDTLMSLKRFIEKNKSVISSIRFKGINNLLLEQSIIKLCNALGVQNISFEEKMVKTLNK